MFSFVCYYLIKNLLSCPLSLLNILPPWGFGVKGLLTKRSGEWFTCDNLVSLLVQLVFRTVGYSGADIRNLVNEAGIMSVS